MHSDKVKYNILSRWELKGVRSLAPVSNVVIIVDILSFSTSVDIACSAGASVYPFPWKDPRAEEFSKQIGGVCAGAQRSSEKFSLSPSSLLNIPSGTKLVLPSPNGATLSLNTGNTLTLCGSLRNAAAVAQYAREHGEIISVIPSGEKWKDGSARFAIEDLIGAGAIISHLKGSLSPQSRAALLGFRMLRHTLSSTILNSISGRELSRKGFSRDVDLAVQLNVSNSVPLLKNKAFQNQNNA